MSLLQINDSAVNSTDEKQEYAIGIDLGTSNSAVSYYNSNGDISLLEINGSTLVPSVVCFTENAVFVGHEAIAMAKENSQYIAIRSIKRLMGKTFNAVATLGLPFNIKMNENQDNLLVEVYPQVYKTPEEISAEILKYLKSKAEHYLKLEIKKAVITVPAYFDEVARVATKNSATLANLEVLRLVNEPTSAALAYGLDTEGNDSLNGVYIIYDFGGGTFDVSILKLVKGVFKVLATGGDNALGGDDIDMLIVQHIVEANANTLNCKTITDLPYNTQEKLLIYAKHVKEFLSNNDTFSGTWEDGLLKAHCTITKSAMQSFVQPIIDKTLAITSSVLKDSKVLLADIHGIILVGGSTRIPLITEEIDKMFNLQGLCSINPDEVVALGAGHQSAHLMGIVNNGLLLDVIPLSLGIELHGGAVEKIIYRNSLIPIAKAQDFTTYKDNQTAILIHVVQGERELVENSRSLAKFSLKGIPPLPAGMAKVRVMFTVDADGLLTVTAEEQHTKIKQSIEVKPTWGLSVLEMRTMLEESFDNAKLDVEARLLSQAIIEAEAMVSITEKAFIEHNELIEINEKELILAIILEVKQNILNKNRSLIDLSMQKLDEKSRDFAEKIMNKKIDILLKGKHIKDVNNLL
jgi:molecular chaperone HscA